MGPGVKVKALSGKHVHIQAGYMITRAVVLDITVSSAFVVYLTKRQ